ncbi:aryl-alcohol dehydrogenase-like predicted oxidoreductase [Rivihabitans pingtungensis]|uniref:Aryl-alcohol dehydrogenase-like predicted oxidoreductase n=2 Tax=Rivihabitans pingtungensis TaxID=1054498 RepID=A0A318KMG6_9NEIS|nr:aryl-alcohol dehydrogenase-like predicted oxidoreductase [Rivihabitans pingtungensis]
MGMSEFYGASDDDVSLRALAMSYEIGYRHYDTADMYGQGHNETLLGKFLAQHGPSARDNMVLASKFGIVRDPANKYHITANGRSDYVRECCHASLRRLGVEHIDLYYLHRRDPDCPLEETLGALSRLKEEGKIGAIGLCEVSLDTLRTAHAMVKVDALQSEYSLWSRDIEHDILPACASMGIAVVAFSPLGRGFLTARIDDKFMSQADPAQDLRTRLPRFQPENLEHNLALVRQLTELSTPLGITSAQLALAWLLHKAPHLHVIPGSRTSQYLLENQAAATLNIDAGLFAQLDTLFAPQAIAGQRYPGQILRQSNQ